MTTIPGQVLRFENEVVTKMVAEIEAPIKEVSTIRQILPHRSNLAIDDLNAEYWKYHILSKYNYDLDPSGEALHQEKVEKEQIKTPVIWKDVRLTFNDYNRIKRSGIRPFSDRYREVGLYMAFAEEAVGVIGDSKMGITSFGDETNNVTNATAEQNLTTTILAQSTCITQIQELKANLGSPGGTNAQATAALKRYPLIMLMNTAAYDKGMSVFSTLREEISAIDVVNTQLAKFGAPGSEVVEVPNLFGSVAENAGLREVTVNATAGTLLMAYSPEHALVLDSILQVDENEPNAFDGYKGRWQKRYVPVFRKQEAFLSGKAAVVA